jgi:hypothetical protein
VEWGSPGARRHVLSDFKMDFAIADATFQETGPVRLTVTVNGQPLGNALYTNPGGKTFQQVVPPGLLRSDGFAVVQPTLDKCYFSPTTGTKPGYIFVRGGFVRTAASNSDLEAARLRE